MKENTLKAVSVFCAVLGLVLVYMASTTLSSTQIQTNQLSMKDIGKAVKVCGEVESKRTSKGHIFFTLSDGYGSINIVVFNSTAMKLNETGRGLYGLREGNYACATGKLTEYPEGSGLSVLCGRTALSDPGSWPL